MAKIMALIGDAGIVANVEWCSDSQLETDAMKDPEGRPVEIGDSYSDGKWYRDGNEILTPLDAALQENEKLNAENAAMLDDMANMIEEVYQSDMEMMGI